MIWESDVSGRDALRLRGPVLVLVWGLVLAALTGHPAAEADVADDCEALEALELPQVNSISAELDSDGEAQGNTGLPDFCSVHLTVSEAINIAVWLPVAESYNGRLQSVGGGGYAGRISYGAMAGALRGGYATASTDTGHEGGGDFAFTPDGDGSGLNEQLIEDFASRSLFEMTEKTQTLIEAFYGEPEAYAYWNGCSTGGRQGLMHVQRMPEAYDGVLAEAPAINWDRFIPAEIWPQVVFDEEYGDPASGPAFCKLQAATEAAVEACDTLDGVKDGLIDDPRRCDYDAHNLVGTVLPCGEFTATDARAINRIWEGPVGPDGEPLWYGLAKGAPLFLLAGSPGVPPFHGPFPIAVTHQQWVEVDPTWDWRTFDYAEWLENWHESQTMFNDVIGTDDPDISAFREAGGKVLIFHGWDDQLIMPEGSIDYYERIIDEFGSWRQVQQFARLFMVPGLWHCGGGPGLDPVDPFGALVDWVEHGDAPDQLLTSDGEATRPVCAYPYVPRWDGTGDPDQPESFDCKPNYGRWGTPGKR